MPWTECWYEVFFSSLATWCCEKALICVRLQAAEADYASADWPPGVSECLHAHSPSWSFTTTTSIICEYMSWSICQEDSQAAGSNFRSVASCFLHTIPSSGLHAMTFPIGARLSVFFRQCSRNNSWRIKTSMSTMKPRVRQWNRHYREWWRSFSQPFGDFGMKFAR